MRHTHAEKNVVLVLSIFICMSVLIDSHYGYIMDL